ncbi:MAG: MFS transporter [Chloroflexota bacterium]
MPRLPFRADPRPTQIAAPGIEAVAAPDLPPGRFNNSLRAFQHRNYRLFYIGQSASLIGTWMQTAAQAWLVTELTDSELALGLVTFMQFLPIMLFVLPAGVIADRVPKRNFLVLTQGLAMLQAIILAGLVISGHAQLWEVYILAAMLGLSSAFDLPTRQAFAIEMVGRDDLLNAIALNSAMFNGARLIGPAIGGFIIAGAGVEAVFVLNALSFIPIIISLYMIRQSELFAPIRKPPANPLKELKEGISFAWRTPAIRLIIIMVALIGMFGYNFTVMLPLLDKHVLHHGSVAFGFLIASVGLGSLISSLLVAGRAAATRYQLFAGATAFTILLALVAASHSIFLTIALLAGVGAAGTVFATTANTSLQIASPDYMRGRVVSLYMLLFAGSTPIGGLLMGTIAALVNTQAAIVVFAALCALGTAAGGLYYVRNRSAIQLSADANKQHAPASA